MSTMTSEDVLALLDKRVDDLLFAAALAATPEATVVALARAEEAGRALTLVRTALGVRSAPEARQAHDEDAGRALALIRGTLIVAGVPCDSTDAGVEPSTLAMVQALVQQRDLALNTANAAKGA